MFPVSLLPSFLELILAGKSVDVLRQQLPRTFSFDELAEGVFRFEPAAPITRALDVVISCGIHGNETAPVELVDRLLTRIVSGELTVKSRVLFVFGNLPALRKGVRFVGEDMNRLFGAGLDADDSAEQRRATVLELCLMRFFARSIVADVPRFHYDLHTAIHGSLIEKFAIYPMPAAGKRFEVREVARLGLAGVQAVLLQSTEAPTFSFFGSRYCNAAAFTVELGSARPFGQNGAIDLSMLENYLAGLIAGELPQPAALPSSVQLFRVARELEKKSDDFRLYPVASTDNFVPLEQGMCVAEDVDGRVMVTEENARLVFPSPDVPIGQRAGLIVVPVADLS